MTKQVKSDETKVNSYEERLPAARTRLLLMGTLMAVGPRPYRPVYRPGGQQPNGPGALSAGRGLAPQRRGFGAITGFLSQQARLTILVAEHTCVCMYVYRLVLPPQPSVMVSNHINNLIMIVISPHHC